MCLTINTSRLYIPCVLCLIFGKGCLHHIFSSTFLSLDSVMKDLCFAF